MVKTPKEIKEKKEEGKKNEQAQVKVRKKK